MLIKSDNTFLSIHSIPARPSLNGVSGWYVGADYINATGWPDRCGLANDLNTINGNYSRIAGGLNGLPIVRGVSHATAQRTFGSFTVGGVQSGYSIVIVRRRTNNSFIASLSLTAANHLDGTASLASTIVGTTDTIVGQGANADVSATIDVTVNVWHVLSLTFDNVEQKVRLYTNTQTITGAMSGGIVSYDTVLCQDGAGEIAEFLTYRRKLSNVELAQNRNYLAQKYGLTVSV